LLMAIDPLWKTGIISRMLGWDDSYAIALLLHRQFPDVNLKEVSLDMIYRWTLALPGFIDDRELVNDAILSAILQEWFEEANEL